MIKKIRSNLALKICLLMIFLLLGVSGITYVSIAGFLPAFYSSKLEQGLDEVSRELAETISTHKSLEDASAVIELFEAGSQVTVLILDENGEVVWPCQVEAEATAVVEDRNALQEGSSIEVSIIGEREAQEAEAAGREAVDEKAAEEAETGKETDDTGSTAVSDVTEPKVTSSIEPDEKEAAADEGGSGAVIESVEIQDWPGIFAEAEEGQEGLTYAYYLKALDAVEIFNGNTEELGKVGSAIKHYDLNVGNTPYIMLVFGGMQPVNQAMEILRQIFPYILGIAVIMAVLFALVISFYVTSPVIRMSRISRKMAALDFSDTYRGRRTDELGELGRSLNEMAEGLSDTLESLQQANAKLKSDIELEREQERKRMEFFSAVSHELKTPVTVLKGHLTGMLQGIGAYHDHDRYLRRSLETTETMEQMVRELLAIARMEKQERSMQKTDLAEQMRLQLAELTELIEEKDLKLCIRLPEHLWMEADSGMIEKVFRNLLVNAVRYTPAEEGNEIRVSLTEEKEGICGVIENTGVHIPEAALPHLFEAFYRVETSRSRKTGGSGLGLYIVRMALEQHDAAYGAENTEEGVKFWFRFSTENT